MQDKNMVLTWTSFIEAYVKSLRADCDLDFNPATWFLFATHILSWWSFVPTYFLKSCHDKVIGRTRTGFIEAYAQSLRVDCDLDF